MTSQLLGQASHILHTVDQHMEQHDIFFVITVSTETSQYSKQLVKCKINADVCKHIKPYQSLYYTR